jgi:NitT/TauT family transport system ATP-binding protein
MASTLRSTKTNSSASSALPGCGKTTLLNIIAGLEKPTSGEVTINDHPIVGPGPDRGVIFQQYAFFPWRSVKSNIMYGLKYIKKEVPIPR